MPWFIVPPKENIVHWTGFGAEVLKNLGLTPYATKQLAEQAKANGGVLNQLTHPGKARAQEGLLQQNAKQTAAGFQWNNIFLRVAEGVVGIVLLAIGLNALLKQSTGVDAASVAKKVVK